MSPVSFGANPSHPELLPTGRRIVSLAELAGRAKAGSQIHYAVHAGGAAPSLLSFDLGKSHRVVHLVADLEQARVVQADIKALHEGLLGGEAKDLPPPLLLAAPDHSPFADVHPDRRLGLERARTLFHLAQGLPFTWLVVTAGAWLRKVPARALLSGAGVLLELGQPLDTEGFARHLESVGYLRGVLVEDPGTFAIRGGIVDVWPAGAPLPLRAELFGDQIATLREFSPESQRVGEAHSSVWVSPAREAIVTPTTKLRAEQVVRALADAMNMPSSKARALVEQVSGGRTYFGGEAYLPAFSELVPLGTLLPGDVTVVIEEPSDVLSALREARRQAEADALTPRERAVFRLDEHYQSEDDLRRELTGRAVYALARGTVSGTARTDSLDELDAFPLDAPSLAMESHVELTRTVKALRKERGHKSALDPLVERLEQWGLRGLGVTITARVPTQTSRIATLLGHRGLDVAIGALSAADRAAGSTGQLRVVTAGLSRGVISPSLGIVLLTEEEIFGERAHRPRTSRRTAKAALDDLRALSVGDFVVHVDHGIGRYKGLERRVIDACPVELLVVEYDGGTLYLPIYRINQIQKYTSLGGSPKVDRLGGYSFAKTKARVKKQVRLLADQLLRLYAERSERQRAPLVPEGDAYAEFEATFPFEETPDQAVAISEVLADLGSSRLMDRIVLGDVGFGKTEVALRAAFVAASLGRQVALLCPTTVLAQQHFATFSARLSGYPLTVAVLSRFQSESAVSEAKKRLKAGTLDIAIGTHRLLSNDIHFKNLGLLIVDEEQRFGVEHKERIKHLRPDLDVLTLSATPIPRTLHMAVSGLRDMSLIQTAPTDRRPIRTIVSRYDRALLTQAVERELSRGGQVFYVYNRVEGIEERAVRLQELVPSARVGVAHGRMREVRLERAMLDFVEGRYDVLVATAIIESGLDIPRANTIIIDRADYLGLAQLYQLRGRVGRSRERAYCYLIVPNDDQLTDEARARVEALERHAELGSGFHIATLDMQLRGTGDLLGAEQSGYAESVGLDLFCKMLEEATRELRGEPVLTEIDPDLHVDVEALLPEDYVEEIGVRLTLYKRFAGAETEDDVADLARELTERFGAPPPEATRFIELMRLKTELRRLRVLRAEASSTSVTLHLREDTPLHRARLSLLVADGGRRYQLFPDGKLLRRADAEGPPSDGLVELERFLHELGPVLSVA